MAVATNRERFLLPPQDRDGQLLELGGGVGEVVDLEDHELVSDHQ